MPTAVVSANFLAAMQAGANSSLVVVAGVQRNGQPLPGYRQLPVEQASLSVSRSNAQRSTISLTVTIDPTTSFPVPFNVTSPLGPGVNELVVSAGWDYGNGKTEIVPLGVFPIVTATVADSVTDLTLTVDADDRSWSISRRALLQPYTLDGTTTVDQAIAALITANSSGLPYFPQSILPSSLIAPANTYSQGQDPWQASLDLAAGAGYELFVDAGGTIQGRPIPDPGNATVSWTYTDQSEPGLPILGCTRTLTADGIANDFWVKTANSYTTPVQSEAADDNPASPTYVSGGWGDIPSFATSSTASDAASALAEAQADLAASLGQIDTLTLQTVLNPALLVDDVCSVTWRRAGLVNALYVVDGFSSSFTVGGTTTIQLRRVI